MEAAELRADIDKIKDKMAAFDENVKRMVANTNKELDKAHAHTTRHSRKIEAVEKLIAEQVIKTSALNAELDELRETCSTSARLIREMVPRLCLCLKPLVLQLSGSGMSGTWIFNFRFNLFFILTTCYDLTIFMKSPFIRLTYSFKPLTFFHF